MSTEPWEIAIVGGGGVGLTAAVYAARAGRRTAVFERAIHGGQIATTGLVENYPGFTEGVLGADLAEAMRSQAAHHGAVLLAEDITEIKRTSGGEFALVSNVGSHVARAVIVTAGAHYNKLGVPGEEEFTGRGVSWCATCDGAFFRGQEVVVVGGGDAALDEGLFLTRFASSVHLIHRRAELRASHVLQERARANAKMTFTWNSVVTAIEGSETGVERVRLRNLATGEQTTRDVSGVFIFIGQTPNNDLLRGLVPLDAGGHAIVNLRMQTEVPGLLVAGDLRTEAARQLISACGDGATAAINADHYLNDLE